MAATIRLAVMTLLAFLMPVPAWAYVGPGAGLGLLAAFGALLTAVVAAVGFLVLWPLRLRRARRARLGNTARQPGQDDLRPGG